MQGVGFRAFTRREAAALGVRGTVRNLPDGRVEILAAADPEVVERFRQQVIAGPSFGRVDRLDAQPAPGFEPPPDFRIVY